ALKIPNTNQNEKLLNGLLLKTKFYSGIYYTSASNLFSDIKNDSEYIYVDSEISKLSKFEFPLGEKGIIPPIIGGGLKSITGFGSYDREYILKTQIIPCNRRNVDKSSILIKLSRYLAVVF